MPGIGLRDDAGLKGRLLDALNHAVIATDRDGRVVFWNAWAERLYGWSAEEVIGRDILEVTPVDPGMASELLATVSAGGSWSGEHEVRRKDGARFTAFVTISAIPDADGASVGTVGFSRVAEQTTRELHYEALFQAMSEGFAICQAIRAPDGRLVDYTIVEINPALLRMLGVGPEVVGTRLSASGAPAGWLEMCQRVLDTGKPERFEFHNRTTGRWHEIMLNRITAERLAQFFHDITERKAAEQRQAELFDELNHRVKNNLALVAGFLQIQARGADETVAAQLNKAVDRVHAIADVHGVLYRGGRRDDVDFGEYLRGLCDRLESSLLDDGRVGIVVEAEAASIPLDHAVPLGMVVNELVTNAAKHAFPGGATGTIAVRFGRDAEGLVLSVADSGAGLSGEPRPGGLGMKLVQSLVGQVGGELRVRQDQGAAFEVRLPG